MPPIDLAVVVGEASGDLLASLAWPQIHAKRPHLRAEGVAGPRLRGLGVDAVAPMERLAVRGYVEVLRHYPGLLRLRRQLIARWSKDRPGLFLGVDAPDFNLALEHSLRVAQVPVVHLVGPSIWAWRPERIEQIRRSVDHMLVLFPFEESIYQNAGIPVTYVGHPLAQVIAEQPDRAGARLALGLDPARPVVAVMPGSRMAEVEWIAPAFLRAAALLAERHPELQWVAPMAGEAQYHRFEQLLQSVPGLSIQVLRGRSTEVLNAAHAALVGSGTATLEAALHAVPMVIGYAMPKLSWWLTQRKMLQPWVGLPNILAQRFVVPEFLQHDLKPQALAAAMEPLLEDSAKRREVLEQFALLHHSLKRDTSGLIAEVVEAQLRLGRLWQGASNRSAPAVRR